jgi:hypothetical protein
MTAEEFCAAVQDLLARPVDNLSAEDKAAVVQGCLGKASASASWLAPELLGYLWMIGLPFLALLTNLDWWLLPIIWIVATSTFVLAVLLARAELSGAGASNRLTEDEFRCGVHHLLAQPVDDLVFAGKAEAFQACLVDMKQKAKRPWWSRALQWLPGFLLQFAGVATVVVLFPGLAWFWWLILGIIVGVLVAVLLMLVCFGVRHLVKPVGPQAPCESTFRDEAVEPSVDA